MVNRSRNNAKSRRRSRRGGAVMNTVPPEVNQNPSMPGKVNTTPVNNRLSITDKVSNLTDGASNAFDGAVNGASDLAGSAVNGASNAVDGAVNGAVKGVSDLANGTLSGIYSFVDSAGYYTGLSSKEETQQLADQQIAQQQVENPQIGLQQGGRGLGLTYYATPVNGLRVAEPTYMEYYKGGKRSAGKRSAKRNAKRRTRRCKSKRCKKTCRKQHRHKRKY